jgi:3'-phosphoadenosine 5'-phosphosulfate sulfotransferase (PAPS reductase)/FAD synthetase
MIDKSQIENIQPEPLTSNKLKADDTSVRPTIGNTPVVGSTVSIKRFISFSGGVESTTMCVLYGKGATAIWCDTGAEHDLMYQRIDEVEKELKVLHSGEFNLIRVKNEKYIGLKVYAKWSSKILYKVV